MNTRDGRADFQAVRVRVVIVGIGYVLIGGRTSG
jgi:hypothetical protein